MAANAAGTPIGGGSGIAGESNASGQHLIADVTCSSGAGSFMAVWESVYGANDYDVCARVVGGDSGLVDPTDLGRNVAAAAHPRAGQELAGIPMLRGGRVPLARHLRDPG